MITVHGSTTHVAIDGLLLVFDTQVFLRAIGRGKAVKRAQARQAREAIMQEAVDRKRSQQQEKRS